MTTRDAKTQDDEKKMEPDPKEDDIRGDNGHLMRAQYADLMTATWWLQTLTTLLVDAPVCMNLSILKLSHLRSIEGC